VTRHRRRPSRHTQAGPTAVPDAIRDSDGTVTGPRRVRAGVPAYLDDAIAAIHASGMAPGNVHPGTVLIAGDGRVVLTDARADEATTPEADGSSLRELVADGPSTPTALQPWRVRLLRAPGRLTTTAINSQPS
jgi:hypothetical protein